MINTFKFYERKTILYFLKLIDTRKIPGANDPSFSSYLILSDIGMQCLILLLEFSHINACINLLQFSVQPQRLQIHIKTDIAKFPAVSKFHLNVSIICLIDTSQFPFFLLLSSTALSALSTEVETSDCCYWSLSLS